MGRPPEPPEPHDGSLPDDSIAGELGALLGSRELGDEAVDRMRAMLSAPIDEDLAAAHLSAIFTALDEGPGAAGDDVIDLRSRRRNRALFGGAVVATVLSLTGGLAAAGTLPAPVQDAVASMARVFSVDLPTSEDDTSDDTVLESPGSTAPGQTGNTPGQTGDTPGDTAPGQTGNTPGDTAPGQTGNTPGDTAPGRTGNTPGDTAPGQTGNTPGDTAPGQTGNTPGQTGSPPGATPPRGGAPPDTPGATAPGAPPDNPGSQSGNTPGATAPGGGAPPDTPGATAPGAPAENPSSEGGSGGQGGGRNQSG